MSTRGRPSVTKRQKEMARRERQRQKEERRAERRANRAQGLGALDEDLENIEPGPRPPPSDEENPGG